jgi:hypothetical protein
MKLGILFYYGFVDSFRFWLKSDENNGAPYMKT